MEENLTPVETTAQQLSVPMDILANISSTVQSVNRTVGNMEVWVNKINAAVPYIVIAVALGLSSRYVPDKMKGAKVAIKWGALALVGIGVYKILKK